MAEYTEEEKMQFRREIDRKRAAGRRIDPTFTCITPGCGFKCTESYARQMGIRACPNCGSTQIRINTLDYHGGIPENPLPSVQEAEWQSRSQRPWVR